MRIEREEERRRGRRGREAADGCARASVQSPGPHGAFIFEKATDIKQSKQEWRARPRTGNTRPGRVFTSRLPALGNCHRRPPPAARLT
ncbi:hypothetical protein EVAR_69433_1 [Eumeta japonica]|uniref:Uncharacterized protein n=1 Tax=Eumeta variegata TaxID=151549 RepID=A0A4C2A637_EUMVA|nr:hypothetical protein EVAR_69433_1 [Eumeta japonica]